MDFESWLRKQLSSAPLEPGAELSPHTPIPARPVWLRPRGLQLIVSTLAVLLAVGGMIGAQRAGALDGRLLLPSHPQALPISTWTGTEARPVNASTPEAGSDRQRGASPNSRGSGSVGQAGATTSPESDHHNDGGGHGTPGGPGHGPSPNPQPSPSDDGGGHGHGGDPSPDPLSGGGH